ncbi:unnamed protein product [Medioppia subpectinata]|uniref:DUF8206 domain-containing protein n=1 Tax=Medioppia subpectinata TaxID=1979941 RepID=A0A7R9KFW5_9ACAR|nr:unnamed protein product [Medioppia subpectinata]CAG2101447.1 unnamed protein product [Medioppia subpectinata]
MLTSLLTPKQRIVSIPSPFDISWLRSAKECQRLFNYIKQLPAHKVMDTLSLNNAKQIISLLTEPLADIAKNIADNVNECKTHRLAIKEFSGTIDELEKQLYIPSVEIITESLDRPKTVCSDGECCERIKVNGITEIIYTGECHSPCYLHFNHSNFLGNIRLLQCKAFNKQSGRDRDPGQAKQSWFARTISAPVGLIRAANTVCHECGHSYEKHRHLLYETRAKLSKVHNKELDSRLESARNEAAIKERQIQCLNERIVEMETENETILKSMSMFARFLADNALTPVNDAFKDYVQFMIETVRYGPPDGAHTGAAVERLECILREYNEEKALIEESAKRGAEGVITAGDIDKCVDKLCGLKHKGTQIAQMLAQQRRSKVKNHDRQNNLVYSPQTNTRLGVSKMFCDKMSN